MENMRGREVTPPAQKGGGGRGEHSIAVSFSQRLTSIYIIVHANSVSKNCKKGYNIFVMETPFRQHWQNSIERWRPKKC